MFTANRDHHQEKCKFVAEVGQARPEIPYAAMRSMYGSVGPSTRSACKSFHVWRVLPDTPALDGLATYGAYCWRWSVWHGLAIHTYVLVTFGQYSGCSGGSQDIAGFKINEI